MELMRRHAPWLGLCLLVVAVLFGRTLSLPLVGDEAAWLDGTKDLSTLPSALVHDAWWMQSGAVGGSILWRPLSSASLYLDAAIPGLDRLLSLVLVAGVGFVATLRIESKWSKAAVVLLVLCHPVMLASTAHAAGRPELLLALFGTAAVLTGGWPGAVFTALALFSKETALAIPLLAWLRSRERRDWAPHAGVAAGWLVVWLALVATWDVAPLDRNLADLQSVALAGARSWSWLWRLVWPADPIIGRSWDLVETGAMVGGWLGLVTLAVGLFLYKPTRLGGGLLVAGVLAVSGLFSETPPYGEFRLVWPLVGLAWALSCVPASRWAAVIAVPLFAGTTLSWVEDWKDDASLWADAADLRPDDPLVRLHNVSFKDAEGSQQALQTCSALVAELPEGPLQRRALACQAQAMMQLRRTDEALPLLRRAELAERESAWATTALCIIGSAKKLSDLSRACDEAVRRNPRVAGVQNAAGVVAEAEGDLQLALERYDRAVELTPYRSNFKENRDRVATQLGTAP